MRQISDIISESLGVKQALLADGALLGEVGRASRLMIDSYLAGGRTLFCGNGGSAADAQHFAAELSGRYLFDRPPLPAEALHGNTSSLTAVANDYDYDYVFARGVQASGRPGDVLVGLSTSGSSRNVVRAAQAAREIGMSVVAMTGATRGELADLATVWLPMPSTVTGRIQEAHIAVYHAISEQVEAAVFAGWAVGTGHAF